MKTFKYVFVLHIVIPILIIIPKVSAALQAQNLDLSSASDMVIFLKAALQLMRSEYINFSTYF